MKTTVIRHATFLAAFAFAADLSAQSTRLAINPELVNPVVASAAIIASVSGGGAVSPSVDPTGVVQASSFSVPAGSLSTGALGSIMAANSFPTPPVVTPFGSGTDALTTAFTNLKGTLTLNFPDGSRVTLNAGTGVLLNSKGEPIRKANGEAVRNLGELLAVDNGGLKQALVNAIKTESTRLAGAGADTAATQSATTRLAALMQVVSKADPAGAASYVTAAVSTLTASGSGLSGSAATNAITAVVGAAQSGAGSSQNTAIMNAATTAAGQNNVAFTQTDFNASRTAAAASITTTPVVLDVTVRSGSS